MPNEPNCGGREAPACNVQTPELRPWEPRAPETRTLETTPRTRSAGESPRVMNSWRSMERLVSDTGCFIDPHTIPPRRLIPKSCPRNRDSAAQFEAVVDEGP